VFDFSTCNELQPTASGAMGCAARAMYLLPGSSLRAVSTTQLTECHEAAFQNHPTYLSLRLDSV